MEEERFGKYHPPVGWILYSSHYLVILEEMCGVTTGMVPLWDDPHSRWT